MGEMLLKGLLSSGFTRPQNLHVTCRRPERLDALSAAYGVTASSSNSSAVRGAAIVVVSVKPDDVGGLIGDIAQDFGDEGMVISVAAGVTTGFIEKRLAGPAAVVRAMPNLAAEVRESVTAISPGAMAGAQVMKAAQIFFSSVGAVVQVEEGLMNAVTAVSGSGPAYFAYLCEALISAGEDLGLPPDVAKRLVSQTMLGTAVMLTQGRDPVDLRRAVTSPGGTTAAAFAVIDQAHVKQVFVKAVEQAAERSGVLSKGRD